MPPREHRDLREKKLAPKANTFLSKINSDIRALNSSVLILSQKMKYIVRNEKILGRNLVVLNKRVRSGENGSSLGQEGQNGSPSDIHNELANITSKLEEQSALLTQIQSELETIKSTFAKEDEVKEIKFVVDAINPLEFVSRKDLDQILGQKTSNKK